MQLLPGAVWELHYRQLGSKEWQKSQLLHKPQITISGLKPGTHYQLKVRGGYIAEDKTEPEFFQFSVEAKLKTNPSKSLPPAPAPEKKEAAPPPPPLEPAAPKAASPPPAPAAKPSPKQVRVVGHVALDALGFLCKASAHCVHDAVLSNR
jgi:hypothetical protein